MPAGVQRTVPCDESIDTTPFPYLGKQSASVPLSVGTERRLGPARLSAAGDRDEAVAVALLAQSRTRSARGACGDDHRAAPLAHARRDRLGQQQRPFEARRIAACAGSPRSGNAYAGGFYLRSPAACLPLTFTVAGRSTTVRFGIGRRCSGRTSSG
jgi:hypothetical protein